MVGTIRFLIRIDSRLVAVVQCTVKQETRLERCQKLDTDAFGENLKLALI